MPLAEEKMKPLASRTRRQYVANAELKAKLDELKELVSPANPDGRIDLLIEKLADMALEKFRTQPEQCGSRYRLPLDHQIPYAANEPIRQRTSAGNAGLMHWI